MIAVLCTTATILLTKIQIGCKKKKTQVKSNQSYIFLLQDNSLCVMSKKIAPAFVGTFGVHSES